MPGLQLRDYQEACVAAHFSYFQFAKGNPLFVVPTAGGKSLIIAEFVRRSIQSWPSTRVLMLTHVKELIEQNHDELVAQWGGVFCPVGIFSAGAGRRDAHDQIVFGGIQSVYDKAQLLGRFDLVLIDEAHLVPKKGQGRYLSYLDDLREINPAVKVCGYTATHFRLDGGYLHKGPGRIFTDVAYEVGIEQLVEEGYLAPLIAKRPEHVIDTSGVGTSTGDFKRDELQAAAMAGECVVQSVEETVTIARAAGRKSWLFFATGIEHAERIVAELRGHSVEARAVFGNTDKTARQQIVGDFKAGRLQALVNVGVLTTGFNAPRCDLMAVMRPTQSAALYVQMMGRGMRIFPGKSDCLVLDYGLNVERHGPINRVRPKKAGDSAPGACPVKTCPECGVYVALGARLCNHCGHEWGEAQLRVEHELEASFLSPIDFRPVKPDIYACSNMVLRRHKKLDRPDSLRVDFMAGMVTVSEWVCLEHEGYARRKAGTWWLRFAPPPVPTTIAEAMRRASEIRCPVAVAIIPDGKYKRVSTVYFNVEDVPDDAGIFSDAMEPPEPTTAEVGADPSGVWADAPKTEIRSFEKASADTIEGLPF